MKIEGEHSFRASREQVWEAIQDPEMLAHALPGVRCLEEQSADEYAITIAVGVGSVKGVYDGTFALTDKHEPESCQVRASARGAAGSIDTTARMHLGDGEDGGAHMRYEANAKVTGALAGVGQRLIGAASKKTTKAFLVALDREITQSQDAEPANGRDIPAAIPGDRDADSERDTREASAASGRALRPSIAPAGACTQDWRLLAGSALAGYALALIGIAIGRWTTRR